MRQKKNDRFKLLNQKLEESGLNKVQLSRKIYLSYCCLFKRLTGDTKFTLDDMKIISKVLKLSDKEIVDCFFEREV